MLKSSLQQLYDSSIAYGLKKALIAYQTKTDMAEKIKALQKENNDLKKTIHTLEQEESDIRTQGESERSREKEAYISEKTKMKDEIMRTKVELDKLMSTKLIIWLQRSSPKKETAKRMRTFLNHFT